MARQGFLRNPAPEMDRTPRFQEGNVQVLESTFKVHHPDVPAGQKDSGAKVVLAWKVQRLDETLDVMKDEDDEPCTEELYFGVGGKSLAHVHPGKADSPGAADEDIEDLGDADNTEGNTLFFKNPGYEINSKAGLRILIASMDAGLDSGKDVKPQKHYFNGAGVKAEYLDRIWAPDWVGCIFHMTTFMHPEVKMPGNDGVERMTAYKIVTKVHRGPGEKANTGKGATKAATKSAPKAAAAATGGEEKAASNGAGNESQMNVLRPILNKLAEENEGQTLTVKAFNKALKMKLDEGKVEAPEQLKIMAIYKEDAWLVENGPRFDFTFDPAERTVAFNE